MKLQVLNFLKPKELKIWEMRKKKKLSVNLGKGINLNKMKKRALLKKVIHLAIKTRLFKIQSQKNHRRVAQAAISS
ncbi:hypothetical protein LBK6_11585 [Leptospira borgpetersenii serovar Hardjo]|nr:hypothetical protein LBK6_11585 [Leptospira borgpetersenii serovar Hardjo]AMX62207.1 hypothetical protein LBK9_11625 [Leptospira borgpetersenii serovar Hardjo]AMX65450.1 hypothetical protein LBK30_11645 [Leptospira borgpetersenii serovar Hardjo]AMX68660.1 hypothetical protein LBHA_11480 [Leptospira borgpetersenii serovar Hardjo]